MARVDTVNALLRPMMGKPSIFADRCAVCGRVSPLNQHHIVRRSAGKAFDKSGHELKAPTITLCGFGNNLSDADGVELCHGRAHHGKLHFRWARTVNGNTGAMQDPFIGGHWECLETDEPTDYQTALSMEGWRSIYERD